MLKKLALLALLCPLFLTLHAQTSPREQNGEAEQMPSASFKGDLNKYLADNIKYPDAEKKAGISGIVFVSFFVETDGTITNPKVIKGVPNGPGLGVEALRVVRLMPKWDPAMQNGKAIRTQFNLPFNFKLK